MNVRDLAGKLALAAGSLAFFAFLAELALQLIVPLVYRPRFTRADPVVGWYHNASVTHQEELEGHRYQLSYNSHGFRVPEHAYDKPVGIRRVLVLGDSFTDGSEVGDDETFTWHLQQCLTNSEVINLGVYAYSTAQELIALDHFGLRYRPDLVILLTISNDFLGNVVAFSSFGPAPRFVLDGESLRFEGTDHPSARAVFRATNLPVPAFVHRHSLVYHLINKNLYQRLIAERIEEVRRQRAAELDNSGRIDLYRRLVVRMRDRSAEIGADFLVVFGYLKEELARGGSSPRGPLVQSLDGEGIETVDLFEAFNAIAERDKLYYRNDIHWNARGHAVVANLLRPSIDSRANGPSGPSSDASSRPLCTALPEADPS